MASPSLPGLTAATPAVAATPPATAKPAAAKPAAVVTPEPAQIKAKVESAPIAAKSSTPVGSDLDETKEQNEKVLSDALAKAKAAKITQPLGKPAPSGAAMADEATEAKVSKKAAKQAAKQEKMEARQASKAAKQAARQAKKEARRAATQAKKAKKVAKKAAKKAN